MHIAFLNTISYNIILVRNHEIDTTPITETVAVASWEKSPNNLTRREFLGLTLKAATGLVLSGTVASILESCGRETTTPTDITTREKDSLRCRWTLDQVKSGFISPEAYLEERYNCLPEVVKAKESGMLKGFLYSPSEEDLRTLLPELLSNISSDKQSLEGLVLSSIRGYKEDEKDALGTTLPEIIDVFGARIPIYVGFYENLFSSRVVDNDADVRSMITHELQHVEDYYKGIRLNDVYLSYDTITPKTFRFDFLEQLTELRAIYKELEDIFRERVEKGETSVSSLWFGSQGANYLDDWNSLKEYPASDLEQRVRQLQFEQFKGIVPEKSGDTILIHFNLFGKQDTAVIVKQELP